MTLKQALKGYEGYSPDEKSQHGLLILLFLLTIPLEILFSYINYTHGRTLLSASEMISAMVLLPWLLLGLRHRWLPFSRELLLLNGLIIFTLMTYDGGIGGTGIYWSQCFPFLAFFLMGVRIGWRWISAFMLLYLLLLGLYFIGYIELNYDQSTFRYAPSMLFVFTVIALMLQLQQERHHYELSASEARYRRAQDELEKIVALRTEQLQQINEKLSREVDEKIEAIQKHELAEVKYQHSQKMESLGTLVGGIAHDFNNMLSGITANLYLLQRKVDEPNLRKRLDKIGELSIHAADMIRQLMTFARKDQVELKVFDLRTFIKEAYKLAKVSIPAHIRCEAVFSDDELLIRGESTQIQQILMNLMNNARDAVRDSNDPFVSVSLSSSELSDTLVKGAQEIPPGNYAVLSVQDNGCGIPKEQIGRIFEPFFTTKKVGAGTGLGLSMVYGAVRSHGGYIDVVSYPGSGTRISLYFPIIEGVEHVVSGEYPVIQGENELILLVDDDQALLEVHEQLLVEMGYRVVTANDGLKAVNIYKSRHESIQLIIMDVVMPVLSGPAAADQIRKINSAARIIFITGYDRDHDSTCEVITDQDLVLNKPLGIDKLSRVIREQLSRP